MTVLVLCPVPFTGTRNQYSVRHLTQQQEFDYNIG
jgi:hypothetical protein